MHLSKRWGTFTILALALMAPGGGPSPGREVARIRRHLAGAEALLSRRDLSGLDASQRAARARRVAELQAYRERGIFPHNHRLLDRRTPVFVDEHGVRCAMAYLIECSGDAALVRRIAATRNLARIADLRGDPALVAWLDRNGLTLAEAARIQPEYDDVTFGESSTTDVLIPTAGAALSGIGAAMNLSVGETQGNRNLRGLSGTVLGLIGGVLGASALENEGAPRVLGGIAVGLGVTSFVLGLRQLNVSPKPATTGLKLSPAYSWDGRGSRVALLARF